MLSPPDRHPTTNSNYDSTPSQKMSLTIPHLYIGADRRTIERMSKEQQVAEFIPAVDFEEVQQEEVERVYEDTEPYSEVAQECQELTKLAESGNGVSRISVPRELKRQKVVNAFQDAFELIGGVPRLAHWADQSPSAFYKLYARLLPTTAQQQLEHSGEIIVKHVLPRGKLDDAS